MIDKELAELHGRVGIFGGSFDPVTTGHVEVASRVAEAHQLGTIIFVPAAQSPFKPGGASASAKDRVEMLKLALAGQPKFIVSDYETQQGGTSYTIDTVKFIRSAVDTRLSELYLVIGADCVSGLKGWREIALLLSMVELIVVGRRGYAESFDEIPGLEQLRDLVSEKDYLEIGSRFVPGIGTPVSSSDVRLAIKENRNQAQLDPAVMRFIEVNGLYDYKETPG